MKKIFTVLMMAYTCSTFAQDGSIISTIPGLIVHIPFTNTSTDLNGNYQANAAEIGIIPTITGNWLENYPVGTAKRADRLLNSNAISLTGTNPIEVNFDISGNEFSLSFWINPDDQLSSGIRRVFTALDNDNNEIFYVNTNKVASPRSTSVGIRVNHNTPVVQGFTENNRNFGSAISIGWQYMTFTFSDANDNISLYTNGELVQTYTTTISPAFVKSFYIGTVGGYTGRIDEISVFDRALNSAEIQSLFNRCAPINFTGKIEPTVPMGQGAKSVCATGSEFYAISLTGSALSGYWSANSPLGGFIRTFSGLSVNISNLTTSGHTQVVKYIASNECVVSEEINFNSTQTAAVAAPIPFISPLNSQNFTTILGCSSQGFKLNITGDNTVNSTFQLQKYNLEENRFTNTQLTAVNNQFTIAAIPSASSDKTINTGTYLGIATNACGVGTTVGFVVQDLDLEFTENFQRYTPTPVILARVEATSSENQFYFIKTVVGIPANKIVVLNPGIVSSTAGGSFIWTKNGTTINNTSQSNPDIQSGCEVPVPGCPNYVPMPPCCGGPGPIGAKIESMQAASFAGANVSSLTITGFSTADYGTYRLTAYNTCSSITYYFDFVTQAISTPGNNLETSVPGNNTTSPGDNITSFSDDLKLDYNVYPNPSKDYIVVENNTLTVAQYTIMDLYGVAFISGKLDVGQNKINFVLPKGLYILTLNNAYFKILVE